MLSLILGLAVIGMVVFIILNHKEGYSEGFFLLAVLFAFIAAVLLVVICCMITMVATESIIDEKIAMYQEENTAIEQDIDRIIDAYLQHEQDTYADLKTEESSITLVTLFPELKSDTLVQQQLEIYVANNQEIKSLKEQKINIATTKFLLYFGK